MLSVTWLCLDPLLKTVYTLRCFYGSSLKTGHDLLREFPASGSTAPILALVVLFLALTPGANVHAAEADDSPPASISSGELDESIARVILEPEFMWRFPPDIAPPETTETSTFQEFVNGIVDSINKTFAAIWEWIRDAFFWIKSLILKLLPSTRSSGGEGIGRMAGALVQFLLFLLGHVW